MKIFYRNASALLFEKANSLSQSHNSWRCIHLNLSSKRQHYSQTVRTYFIIKGLTETLGESDGFIYLCGDGDIFILFQGQVKPILMRLAHYFGDIDLNYAIEKSSGNFFNVYDLSKDWSVFLNLCFIKSLQDDVAWDEAQEYAMQYEIKRALANAVQD